MTANARAKQVFQIAYDEMLLVTRAELLKLRGYKVGSALGNVAAKQVLRESQAYPVFIIGHAALKNTREEMAQWLRVNFPRAKIVALNPMNEPKLTSADYNFILNGPEEWLAVVESAVGCI